MTNEERDALIAQGWTPPVAVDPDIADAWDLVSQSGHFDNHASILKAIKRGRELERAEAKPKRAQAEAFLAGIKRGRAVAAEAKPGMVWEKNRGLSTPDGAAILTLDEHGTFDITHGCRLSSLEDDITHYAIITPPEDAA